MKVSIWEKVSLTMAGGGFVGLIVSTLTGLILGLNPTMFLAGFACIGVCGAAGMVLWMIIDMWTSER